LALRTPTQYAEAIKLKYASVLPGSINSDETVEILSVANRPPKQVLQKNIAHVVYARYAELFSLILSELKRSRFIDSIFAGIVLTGGASKVPGLHHLAENIFNVPVRAGMPHNVSGLKEIRDNPAYATGVGLLLHALQQRQIDEMLPLKGSSLKNIFNRMRQWFHGNF
jgi:cell division protein FtsA